MRITDLREIRHGKDNRQEQLCLQMRSNTNCGKSNLIRESAETRRRNGNSCSLFGSLLISNQPMTSYNLKPFIPPSLAAKAAKEQRRKQLEEVRAKRREIYKRFQKKVQLHADSEMI